MKLTALFVARNGRQFINALQQREQRNYQFDFLRPNHSLFPLFMRLVEQYTKIMQPAQPFLDDLSACAKDRYSAMDGVMKQVEYNVYQAKIKKKAEDEAERERVAYASIDWHDFMIVDTIEFTDADLTTDFPPPLALLDLQRISLSDPTPVPAHKQFTHKRTRHLFTLPGVQIPVPYRNPEVLP
jgi:splicing factor 3A subunit 1